MKRDTLNPDLFYNMLWHTQQESFFFDKCLRPEHLKPLEDFLLKKDNLSPYSSELTVYSEARKCVLDFDIYTIEKAYRMGNKSAADFMIDCYRFAAKEGVTEAYNNIGVFLGMTDRVNNAPPYWKKAAESGSACGWINLMVFFSKHKNYSDMVFCLNKLVEMKHPIGYWNLAVSNHFGYLGLEQNILKAKSIYEEMMSLVPMTEKENELGGSNELLQAKTMACFNLARIRIIIEEHNQKNLNDLLNLLTRTPYVIVDNPRINELVNEVRSYIR